MIRGIRQDTLVVGSKTGSMVVTAIAELLCPSFVSSSSLSSFMCTRSMEHAIRCQAFSALSSQFSTQGEECQGKRKEPLGYIPRETQGWQCGTTIKMSKIETIHFNHRFNTIIGRVVPSSFSLLT